MSRTKRLTCAVAATLLAGIGFANCGEDLGPDQPGLGVLAVQPVFTSGSAVVDVTAVRARLTRPGQEGFAADTTVPLATDSGVVEIPLQVTLRQVSEEFLLEILVIGTQGDTVFKGGPTPVTVTSGSDEPTVTEIEIQYVGVGANAAFIAIRGQTFDVPTGGTLLLDAVVTDSTGENELEGTPVLWSSLNPTLASVPDRETGRVVAGDSFGSVAIVARTLTGPADTATVNVVPPRPPQTVRWINAEGGAWTTGANWDLGTPPAPFDTAVIDLAGNYTVTLGATVTLDAFILGTSSRQNTQQVIVQAPMGVVGDITLNTAGKLTLAAGGDLASGGQLLLGGTLAGSATSTTLAANVQGGGGIIDVTTGTLAIRGDLRLITSDIIRGSGTLDLTNAGTVQLGATIAPGTSPGILAIDGNPMFLPATRLAIELDGTNAAQFDRLDVSGTVTFDGVLDVLFPGTFVPNPGDVFTVVTHAGATGQFSTVNGVDLGNGLRLVPEYDAMAFRLATVGPQANFTVQPSNVLPGQDIRPTIEVEFRDPIADTLISITDPVTLSLEANPTGANLVGEVQTLPDGPTAFFGSTAVDRLGGGYTLRASAPGTFSTVSAPFNVIEGIVFAGTDGNFQAVSSLHPNGTNLTTVSSLQTSPSFRSYPRWAPNRLRVAHTLTDPSIGTREVRVASSNGDSVAVVMSDTSGFRPAWNVTGDHLAFHCGSGFSSGQDICAIQNLGSVPITSLSGIGNGGGKTFVTDVPLLSNLDGPGIFAWDPSNPDRLIVERIIQGPSRPVSQLFGVNADGSNAVQIGSPLTTPAGDTLTIEELTLSPDGSFFVFAAENTVTNRARIYRLEKDGTNLQLLTGNPSGFYDENGPVVSPDGSTIIFIQNTFDFEGSDWNYFSVPATGGVPQQMSDEATFFVAFDELGVDFSPDGSQIVFVGVDQSQPAVFVAPVSMRRATYFTDRMRISPIGRADVQPNWRP